MLAARFLTFVSQRLDQKEECKTARTFLLLDLFKHFTSTFLIEKDVFSVSADFDIEARKVVLSAYFQTLSALRERKIVDIPASPQSALLSAASQGEASIFALFGGQGTNEVYLDELQSLHGIYKPFVAPFIAEISREVLVPLAKKHQDTSYFPFGLDVEAWLSNAVTRPSVAYLASVPVSFPLIGLTQLVQYLIVCHVAGVSPGEIRDRLAGATGHSQGIVSAVAIAASNSHQSFYENAKKALKWLFFSGLRGQQVFPVVAVEPTIVKDTVEGGEGVPTPMLSVTGLSLAELEPHLKQSNSHLPPNSQLAVSLHNGPRAFVVTGPSKALYGLVTALRKTRAPTGLDQSKVPFSQRKQVFSLRFLVVGVPYHSQYLGGAMELVSQDLKGEELWTADQLKIPVYHTDDGTRFRLSIKTVEMLTSRRF